MNDDQPAATDNATLCPDCGRTFKNERAVCGHLRRCAGRLKNEVGRGRPEVRPRGISGPTSKVAQVHENTTREVPRGTSRGPYIYPFRDKTPVPEEKSIKTPAQNPEGESPIPDAKDDAPSTLEFPLSRGRARRLLAIPGLVGRAEVNPYELICLRNHIRGFKLEEKQTSGCDSAMVKLEACAEEEERQLREAREIEEESAKVKRIWDESEKKKILEEWTRELDRDIAEGVYDDQLTDAEVVALHGDPVADGRLILLARAEIGMPADAPPKDRWRWKRTLLRARIAGDLGAAEAARSELAAINEERRKSQAFTDDLPMDVADATAGVDAATPAAGSAAVDDVDNVKMLAPETQPTEAPTPAR